VENRISSTALNRLVSRGQAANADTPAKSSSSASEATLDLSPSQLNSIKIEPLGSYEFPVEKDAVGNPVGDAGMR
jgi:hypothetical protein